MRYFILLSFLFTFSAFAGKKESVPPPPQLSESPSTLPPELDGQIEQPDIPAPAKSGKVLAPDKAEMNRENSELSETDEGDIKIVRKGDKSIQEFRRGGRLYMIKVTPDIGPPYYFIDSNGDGTLDTRSSDGNLGANVNMWKIIEWK